MSNAYIIGLHCWHHRDVSDRITYTSTTAFR